MTLKRYGGQWPSYVWVRPGPVGADLWFTGGFRPGRLSSHETGFRAPGHQRLRAGGCLWAPSRLNWLSDVRCGERALEEGSEESQRWLLVTATVRALRVSHQAARIAGCTTRESAEGWTLGGEGRWLQPI